MSDDLLKDIIIFKGNICVEEMVQSVLWMYHRLGNKKQWQHVGSYNNRVDK